MNPNRAVPPEGKVAYYRSDGTGRDTYITYDNGGLVAPNKNAIHYQKDGKIQKGLWKNGEYAGKDLFNSGISSDNNSLAFQNSGTTRRFESPDVFSKRQNNRSSSRNQS